MGSLNLKTVSLLLFVATVFVFMAFFIGWSQHVQSGIDFIIARYEKVRSVAITPDGTRVELGSTVIFRIPDPAAASTQPVETARKMDQLHSWLTTELGGWSRSSVESQSLTPDKQPGKVERRWMYVVGVDSSDKRPAASLIEQKLSELFPEARPVLIISLPHPNPAEHNSGK